MATLTDPVAGAPPGVAVETAVGWGIVCRFDCKDTTLHGIAALEFESDRFAVRQMQVICSPVERHLNEININFSWPDIICLIVKKNLVPYQLAGDLMVSLTDALRAAATPAWCEALRAMGKAGQSEAMLAALTRILEPVIAAGFELKARYLPSLVEAVTPGAVTGEQTVKINPQSDPARGVMVSALKAGEDIYIKVIDDSPLGARVRQQLSGEDDDGNLRAVARPFREARVVGERGDCVLYVDLSPGVVGIAEVYSAVKVKTARSVLQAAVAVAVASGGATAGAATNAGASHKYAEGFSWTPVLFIIIGVLGAVAVVLLIKMITG